MTSTTLFGRNKLLQKQVHIVKKALYWFLNTFYTHTKPQQKWKQNKQQKKTTDENKNPNQNAKPIHLKKKKKIQ